jgi:hypothetical protein
MKIFIDYVLFAVLCVIVGVFAAISVFYLFEFVTSIPIWVRHFTHFVFFCYLTCLAFGALKKVVPFAIKKM